MKLKEGDKVELFNSVDIYTVTYVDLEAKKFSARLKEHWSIIDDCDFSDVERLIQG